MDDFIQSFSTPAAACQLTNDLRTVLQRGGFRLTKFISNKSDALSSIPAEDREKSASQTKVLGQTWCLRTDSYTAPPPNSVDNPITLRQLFSLVSSIFDPIGLLSPLVIQFKISLQSLWKLGQTWDQAIPDHIQTSVTKLTDCYRAMPTVSVPRCAFRSATTVELHVFTEHQIPLSPLSFMLANQLFRIPQLNKSSSLKRAVSNQLNKKAFQNWNLKPPFLESVFSE